MPCFNYIWGLGCVYGVGYENDQANVGVTDWRFLPILQFVLAWYQYDHLNAKVGVCDKNN